MTTLVFAADCHIGNHKRFGGEMVAGINERGRLSLEAFGRAAERARDLHAAFFALGDVFDDDRPNPQIVAATQRLLRPGEFLMVGNHDQTSDIDGHNALAPLRPVATIVEAPRVVVCPGVDVGLVPFRPLPAREYIPELARQLAWSDAPVRLLGIHAGVKDGSTAPWLRDSKDAIDVVELASLAAELGISAVFCGNWHDHRAWEVDGVRVVQIGSLCPTGFDDLTLEHGIAIWRDGEVTFEDVPGPRFAKANGPDEFQAAIDRAGNDDSLFVSFTVAPDELAEAQAVAEAARHVEHHLKGVEVLADGKVLEAQARQAAEAARATSSLDEALSAYVEAMSLPEGVDRAEVLERARGYLK